MASEREYQSAVMLLRAPPFDDRFAGCLDGEGRRIDWERILHWPYPPSRGEQILIDAARICWSGRGTLDVGDALATLDSECWPLLCAALVVRRPE
jgi:hypothetical protein